jgi:hypothetical protein
MSQLQEAKSLHAQSSANEAQLEKAVAEHVSLAMKSSPVFSHNVLTLFYREKKPHLGSKKYMIFSKN